MKLNKIIGIVLVGFGLMSAQAQTNLISTNLVATSEKVEKSEAGKYELTLGGAGFYVPSTKESQFGFDFSIYSNPFEKISSVWFGYSQGLSWEPTFAGSSDFSVVRATHLWKELWVNTGWSVGGVYDRESIVYRTGPELTLQYYIGDNAFVYTGANYDVWLSDHSDKNLRYSFGLGLTW